MKLHNSKTTFLLTLFEVYGVLSAAIKPKPESPSDSQVLNTLISSLNSLKDSLAVFDNAGKVEESHFKRNPFLLLSCRYPWVLVGRTCLFTDLSKATPWHEGRNFCKELHVGADLVVFRDANEFAEILRHVRAITSSKKGINFWVGGSDLARSEEWLWITGEPMPRGSPFWGVDRNGGYEPHANSEHCAFLYFTNRYYLHDVTCTNSINPLCQYNPFSY